MAAEELPGGLVTRRARADDIEAVAVLFSRSHRTLTFLPDLHTPAEDLEHWRHRVFAQCAVWVAERDGSISGIMALDHGWIVQLQVDPDRFRQGVGSALVRHAQSLEPELQLWCFQANAPARALYRRHGFVAVEFTDGAGNEEKTPDVRYRWAR